MSKKKKLKKRDAELQEKITEQCQGFKILAAITAVDGIIKMQPTPPQDFRSEDLSEDLKKILCRVDSTKN